MRPKPLALIFLLLTVINILVFFFRDHFQHRPLADYDQLYGYCDEDCKKKWSPLVHAYPEEEFAEAKRITDSITKDDSINFQKAESIGLFLNKRFKHRLGRPTADVLTASPLNQFKKLTASDSSELWCGNYAMMFAYFCWAQGIPCRIIEIMKPGDRHVVNECYITDLNRWILTDLTNNTMFVQNRDGFYIDLPTLLDTLGNGGYVTIRRPDGSLENEQLHARNFFPHYRTEFPLYFYHSAHSESAYTGIKKLKRYVLGESWWYDIYDTKGVNNFLFRLKQVLLFLWAVSFFVFLFKRAKFKA